jgi:hypothetical protein
MGRSQSTTESSLKVVPWQTRDIKFQIGIDPLFVEEVREPWDLWVESAYLHNSFGAPLHQLSVKNGLERIFSVRSYGSRMPLFDILTMPVGARTLSTYWSMKRGLKTSSPMTIDGQDLIVLDVLGDGEKRANKAYLAIAKAFFVARGGKLNNEHTNNLAVTTEEDVTTWTRIVHNELLENLFISSTKPKPGEHFVVHAVSAEEAVALLRVRYWWKMVLDADDPDAEHVLDHLSAYKIDRPRCDLIVIGNDTRKLNNRANEIMR